MKIKLSFLKNINLSLVCLVIPFLISYNVKGQSSSSKSNFDTAAARIIIEKRSHAFEKAIKEGDSIAVGDIYTLDTKIIGEYAGRNNIIREAHQMARDSMTGLKFTIINLWGNDNIIVEDAYVEFYYNNGKLISKGNCMLVWKKENDEWRIFRDVYKPDKK